MGPLDVMDRCYGNSWSTSCAPHKSRSGNHPPSSGAATVTWWQGGFWVRGAVNQNFTYAWWPFNAPDTPGVLYRPVEIPL